MPGGAGSEKTSVVSSYSTVYWQGLHWFRLSVLYTQFGVGAEQLSKLDLFQTVWDSVCGGSLRRVSVQAGFILAL